MRPGQPVTVVKLDHRGEEKWRYQGVALDRGRSSIILEAIYDQPDDNLHGIPLRRGDRFVETHYIDRWYNVFAVYDVETGLLKGWYCNITRPARIDGDQVVAEDLTLDLIVRPDGSSIVLDELEFEAQELSSQDRASARSALRELQALAAGMEEPFRKV